MKALSLRVFVVIVAAGTAASAAPVQARSTSANASSTVVAETAPRIRHLEYAPTPAIQEIPELPDPAAVPKANPTGNWNAYDLNVFETIRFPQRQPGDRSDKDAPGGAEAHGSCPAEGCANHAREFNRFWLRTMARLVKPFGGVVRKYRFYSEGSGPYPVFSQPPGHAFNLQATIPGAVHPEQMVIVAGHNDQTDSGPASAWDSAEGHATVVRIAKLMTDYWGKTGTRPAVSVKFTTWSAEEAGTIGSQAYVDHNVLPFPNAKVLGYFNLDPCAGAYPAFFRGNPLDRVPMVMQLADPGAQAKPGVARAMRRFNRRARAVVGEVFDHLDDRLTDVAGEPEIFVSDEEAEVMGVASQEDEIVPAVGGLALFSSDYANFEEIGVPIFNLFPDFFGPHADGTQGRSEGITILHSPNDNLLTVNALTGIDQTGRTPSEGWYKGLELCAHLNSWLMLDPDLAGVVGRSTRPVAYFEALHGDRPITFGRKLNFDAAGSHAYRRADSMALVRRRDLRYRWNFGDGGRAFGRRVGHSFARAGTYEVRLTVTAPNGLRDVMVLKVRVG